MSLPEFRVSSRQRAVLTRCPTLSTRSYKEREKKMHISLTSKQISSILTNILSLSILTIKSASVVYILVLVDFWPIYQLFGITYCCEGSFTLAELLLLSLYFYHTGFAIFQSYLHVPPLRLCCSMCLLLCY